MPIPNNSSSMIQCPLLWPEEMPVARQRGWYTCGKHLFPESVDGTDVTAEAASMRRAHLPPPFICPFVNKHLHNCITLSQSRVPESILERENGWREDSSKSGKKKIYEPHTVLEAGNRERLGLPLRAKVCHSVLKRREQPGSESFPCECSKVEKYLVYPAKAYCSIQPA